MNPLSVRLHSAHVVAILAAVLFAAASVVLGGASTAHAEPLAPESTTTTITMPAEYAYGSQVSVAVSVTDAEGQAVDGTVFLKLSGTTYGSGYPLTDGALTVDIAGAPFFLSPDAWTMEADFVPADSVAYAPSSDEFVFTVNPGVTSTNVSLLSDTPTVGAGVAIHAGVAHDASTSATGSIDFYADGALLGSVALGNGSAASIDFVPTTAGSVTITAVYSGDRNYAASSSEPLNVTVAAASSPAGTGDQLAETGAPIEGWIILSLALALMGGVLAGISRLRAIYAR